MNDSKIRVYLGKMLMVKPSAMAVTAAEFGYGCRTGVLRYSRVPDGGGLCVGGGSFVLPARLSSVHTALFIKPKPRRGPHRYATWRATSGPVPASASSPNTTSPSLPRTSPEDNALSTAGERISCHSRVRTPRRVTALARPSPTCPTCTCSHVPSLSA